MASPDELRGEFLDDSSPYLFSLFVDAAEAGRAAATLAGLEEPGFTWSPGPAEASEARFDIRSRLHRHAGHAFFRLLRDGAPVRRYAALEPLRDVGDIWIRRQLAAYDQPGRRRRIEALAGDAALGAVLDCAADGAETHEVRGHAARACSYVLFNEPTSAGCDRVLASAAAHCGDLPATLRYPVGGSVEGLLDAVRSLSSTMTPLGLMPVVDATPVAVLLAHMSRTLRAAAAGLLADLPGAKPDAVVAGLLPMAHEFARRKGQDAGVVAADVAAALADAPATRDVMAALFELSRHEQAETRRVALQVLGKTGGRDVVLPLVDGLLASRSPVDRVAGSALVARHGTVDDIPVAIRAVRLALASRHPRRWDDPAWGANLLRFLWQHRSDPRAAAELSRVRARWEKVHPDLRAWVTEHLSELVGEAGS